jgi:hypothetical protein
MKPMLGVRKLSGSDMAGLILMETKLHISSAEWKVLMLQTTHFIS